MFARSIALSRVAAVSSRPCRPSLVGVRYDDCRDERRKEKREGDRGKEESKKGKGGGRLSNHNSPSSDFLVLQPNVR